MGSQILAALFLGGLMGLFGQSIRTIVGLKTMVDQANSTGVDQNDLFRAARLVVSMVIGFAAGIAATLIVGIQKLIDLQAGDVQLLMGIAAAGYAGSDFIEGFISQYLPGGKVPSKFGGGVATNQAFVDIQTQLQSLGGSIKAIQKTIQQPSFPPLSSARNVFREKAPLVMSKLQKDFSITDIQSAGILGNLGVECLGFTVMQEIHPIAGLGGYGWAQWTGPRRTDFFNWCAQQGLDVNSDAANYGFLKHELETSFQGTISSLKQTQTVSDAVTVFLKEYEKAGVEAIDKRVAWANLALDAFRTTPIA